MDDMLDLLALYSGGTDTLALLAQAKCRMNPDLDSTEVYRTFGIEHATNIKSFDI
jgi:hypothetical protein